MTVLHSHNKFKEYYAYFQGIRLTVILITASAFISFSLSGKILEFVKTGLKLCYSSVIGSVFPFMILTDLIYSFSDFNSLRLAKYCFERVFKINANAIGAYVCGILCGFPLGVKIAVTMYKDGLINREECERLIGFVNNTGPAFVISGIGAAMRGNTFDGFILYISMVLSSLITGIMLGIGKKASFLQASKKEKTFSFTESVKSAGLGTITVSSFIIFFSVVSGLADLLIKNNIFLYFLLPFIEISNAAKVLASQNTFSKDFSLLITSFAVSFSGVSVHLQAKSCLSGTDLSMKCYYKAKLLQGFLSALITALSAAVI